MAALGLLLLSELVTLGNGPYTVLSSLVGNLIGMETPSWPMAIWLWEGWWLMKAHWPSLRSHDDANPYLDDDPADAWSPYRTSGLAADPVDSPVAAKDARYGRQGLYRKRSACSAQ